MAERLGDSAVEALIRRFEADAERIESVPGPTADAALAAIAELTALYGEALARTLDVASEEQRRALAADPLVGHLLALHDLYPELVDPRVRRVLADAEPAPARKVIPVEALLHRPEGVR